MKADALHDGDKVEVMYISGGPDKNDPPAYYYHVVVVSRENGDTVNILTTFINQDINEDNRFQQFVSENSATGKLIANPIDAAMGKNVNKMKPGKRFDKVAINTKFDWSEKNNWPTIVGTLATKGKDE